MRGVRVENMHQRRSLDNDANPRMSMTMDPPFVTLWQAKPPLELKWLVVCAAIDAISQVLSDHY
jgi:hypothetical protein